MYSDIHAALMTHLKDMTGVIGICAENFEYEPVLGTPYLEAVVLNGQGRVVTCGQSGYSRYPGVFQVKIYSPKGAGTGDANDMASLLRARFKPGTELIYGNVSLVISSNGMGPTIPDRQWDIRPFSATFYADVTNS